MSATTKEMADAYAAGVTARNNHQIRSTCPYGSAQLKLKCLWMAGWNDTDMEDKNE
tara:strand:- start:840 stop:1007 length:168 start_codon:yes stop_codon:yes gene_type:complete